MELLERREAGDVIYVRVGGIYWYTDCAERNGEEMGRLVAESIGIVLRKCFNSGLVIPTGYKSL